MKLQSERGPVNVLGYRFARRNRWRLWPHWRRDGKELYFLDGDGELMAVPVKSTAATFEAGVPVALFRTHPKGFVPYDVAPDDRFLIDTAGEGETTLVLNWMAGLKK